MNLDQISLNEESTNEYLNREIQIINENAVFGIKLLKLIGEGSYGKVKKKTIFKIFKIDS